MCRHQCAAQNWGPGGQSPPSAHLCPGQGVSAGSRGARAARTPEQPHTCVTPAPTEGQVAHAIPWGLRCLIMKDL